MAEAALVRCADGECRSKAVAGAVSDGNSLEISGSVGRDAKNRDPDVRTVQDALNQVPPTSGGPVPPLEVDGLCYGKTLAAIRKFQKEACGFKWPDERVDPNGKTHNRLKEFFVPPYAHTMSRLYAMLPAADVSIMAALRTLGLARLHLLGKPGFSKPFALVDKYFHLGRLRSREAHASLARLTSTFTTMRTAIAHSSPLTAPGTGYFQEDPKSTMKGAPAYTYYGGFTRRSRTKSTPPMTRDDDYAGRNERQDMIVVLSRNLNTQPNHEYLACIVHELAHFCGPEVDKPDRIGDHSYRNRKDFLKLSPETAMRTADCYSEFTGEAVDL